MESVAVMRKEAIFSCLVPPPPPTHTSQTPPVFPPLTQLSTLRRGKAKQTAVQTPQIITQESYWERCVGSGCDSMCAPVFTDIHLHMSRPLANHKAWMLNVGFGFFFGVGWIQPACGTHKSTRQIRLYLHKHASFTFSIRCILLLLHRAHWSREGRVKHTV